MNTGGSDVSIKGAATTVTVRIGPVNMVGMNIGAGLARNNELLICHATGTFGSF